MEPRPWPPQAGSPVTRDPWWQVALDVLLPPRCVGCGRRGADVCDACVAALRPLGAHTCPRCSAHSPGGRPCGSCGRRLGHLRAVIAAHPYQGTIRAAILAFKYRSRTRLAPFLVAALEPGLARRPLAVDVVAPVPLSPARLAQRGFNQAELLARPLAASQGWPLDAALLVRTRETPQQTRLSSGERWLNLAGAFAVRDPASVVDRRVLLVDDVCTTGATLEACAAPLVRAGAAGVWALVVARDA
ncbi:MAG TPA: ComF family protein [Chloroflexota bacterium]|nr:ComF family protein [Chloroflexota bacterium]